MQKIQLKFKNHKEHITYEDLNRAYGHKGRTFQTEAEALLFQQQYGGYVNRIVNYAEKDIKMEKISLISKKTGKPYSIFGGAKPKKDAKLVVKGWLYSFPGKVELLRGIT